MKIAPLFHQLKTASWARPVLVHTGQHYDPQMSDVFWRELGLPAPDLHLGVGSGTHAEQTAGVMLAYETRLPGAPARLGGRRRRRQFDRRLRAGREKTVPAPRPSRSRAAQRRPDHAGRDQPARHRRDLPTCCGRRRPTPTTNLGAKAWRRRRSTGSATS